MSASQTQGEKRKETINKSKRSLAEIAFAAMSVHEDTERRQDYWEHEIRVLNNPRSGSFEFFSQKYATTDIDLIAERLGRDMRIEEDVIKELQDERLKERYEVILAARSKKAADEAAIQARISSIVMFEERGIKLFPSMTLDEIEKAAASTYRDSRDGIKHLLYKMMENGGVRIIPDMSPALAKFDDLRLEFPNFNEAIDDIENDLILSNHSERSMFRVRPILLNGAPGVGKTAFSLKLSAILGVPFKKLAAGSMQSGAALAGMDRRWANARSGEVFELLAMNNEATGVFVIDEADKLPVSQYFDAHVALLDLLEPESARMFRDEAANIEFDASHLIVIMTSNSVESIDSALLSRLTVKEIQEPTIEQRFEIGKTEFAKVVKGLVGIERPELNKEALLGLAASEIGLRDLLASIRRCIAVAIKDGTGKAVPVAQERASKMRIGF